MSQQEKDRSAVTEKRTLYVQQATALFAPLYAQLKTKGASEQEIHDAFKTAMADVNALRKVAQEYFKEANTSKQLVAED